MLHINLSQPHRKFHFIGIGGISMSGLAEILLKRGFSVSGSDMKRSEITDHLSSLGANVYYEHRETNIDKDVGYVIYTAAIHEDNEELQYALKNSNITTIDRATFLGSLMKEYQYSIAVAGTHGKTTTTSMVSHVFLEAKKDPTIMVGGILNAIQGNIRTGNSEYFITEACEYCDSFLQFNPFIGVILNIEADHLDYFSDLKQIRESFLKFAQKIPSDGSLIINGDIPGIEEIISQVHCNVITFGLRNPNNRFQAHTIQFNDRVCGSFEVLESGEPITSISLNVPGEHNVYNALATLSAGKALGISMEEIQNGLLQFHGTKKRFEIKGKVNEVTIVDDYAHHPTEIKATLKVAKQYPHERLWCVFQPHTYTRTLSLLDDFTKAFDDADIVILADIYAAREKDTGKIHSKDLLQKLSALGKRAYYFSTFDEIENFLLQNCSPGDLLITMGAGDISLIGEELLGRGLSTISTGLSTV